MNFPTGANLIIKNLVINPKFENSENGSSASTLHGWEFVTPRAEISPEFSCSESEKTESNRLVISGTGDRRAFGCWRGKTDLEAGKWYRASVRVRSRDIENPSLSVFAQVAKHFLAPIGEWSEETVLEQVFRHNPSSAAYDGNDVEFYLLATENGRAEFFDPQVVEIAAPEHRMARVATVHFGQSDIGISLEQQRNRIAEKLDEAGALRPDIVALTEFSPIIGVPESEFGSYEEVAETVPDGPLCKVLAAKAKQYGMYVLAGNIERRGKYIFNTAVIFDREGNFAGQYDKTHLTFTELTWGFSCGDSYPVFDLDFGRIGVHICYDEWFPEVARHYAHQGAEILFLPVAGGKPITWRTRALDNGIYFVSAATTPPSMIISSSGEIMAETQRSGVAYADLNLDLRLTNYYGDPTKSYGMPCIAPQMRNRLDDKILDELYQAMRYPIRV